jgi:hypothetical protein
MTFFGYMGIIFLIMCILCGLEWYISTHNGEIK